jgi:hypothetical protein
MSYNNTTPKSQTNSASKTRSFEEQLKQANYFKPVNSVEITKSLTQTIAQANYFAPNPVHTQPQSNPAPEKLQSAPQNNIKK